MTVIIKPLKNHQDARGFVFEPMEEDLLAHQHNMHVVLSRPGAVRGNHYHRKGTEIIAVTGPALVRIKENNKFRDVKVPENEVFSFTFPPGISHAIQNTGSQPQILAAFNTIAHDPNRPDTVADTLI